MATPSTFDALRARERSRRKKRSPPLDIGWQEWASFPDFGVSRVKAKIDTGAKTSAIHAFRIREFDENGRPFASFVLHPEQKRRAPEIHCVAPILDRRRIRSSNGAVEERIVVETRLRMGDRTWLIALSLTDRDAMGYRLLVGRDALKGRVVIHPGKSFLLGRLTT